MTQPVQQPGPTGLLVIDKPPDITSMGVCRKVRWLLVRGGAPKRVKVGHGGTLDPLATGVLVVLVGKATRLCEQIMAGEKGYIAEIDLAHSSTTDDREGILTAVAVPAPPARDDIERACRAFVGTIQQRPPAYSAIKIGGKRAYDIARKADREETDLPVLEPRPVEVHEIQIVDYAWPRLTLDIRCGKGTYIRSLARDIGASLGAGGMLTALRRTRVGRFTIDQAQPLAQLPEPMTQADLLPLIDPARPS